MSLLLTMITSGELVGELMLGDNGEPGGGVDGRRYGVSLGSGPGLRFLAPGDGGGLSRLARDALRRRLDD